MEEELFRIVNEQDIVTPALVFYKNLIEANIDKAITIAGNAARLWPHIKTHKSAGVVRLLIDHGISKFKTATVAEAEIAADCGAEQVILAYPLVGPNISRFIALQQKYPHVRFFAVGDDLDSLRALGERAYAEGLQVSLLVDVDLGLRRTGVPADVCLSFFRSCAAIEGILPVGFHCYDGHHNAADLTERKAAVRIDSVPVWEARAALQAEGTDPILVMGGTPSFPCYAEYDDVFLSPGTCFLNDAGYGLKYQDMDFHYAAAVMTRVISHPAGNRFTLDLGTKGIGSDPQLPRGIILGHEGEYRTIMQNEEHWVLEPVNDKAAIPPVGSVLYVVPVHICTTSALYPSAYVAEQGKLLDIWEISARNRTVTI